MAEEIVITIDKKTGQMSMEGMGFQGNACLKTTDELLKVIGGRGTKSGKPELNKIVKNVRAGN